MNRREACALIVAGVASTSLARVRAQTSASRPFVDPERVAIRGYVGDAMEPFITRDGRYLLFNNRNDPSVNTDLHYGERVDDLTFEYRGEIAGVNTPALEGVPTMDRSNVIYFVSTRSYDQTFSTIYRGVFDRGRVTDVALVRGISRAQPGWVNFDVEVSASGDTLYYVESRFRQDGPATADIAIARRVDTGFERLPNSDEIMKHVNSESLEYAACISSDELTLFFTRAGKSEPIPTIYMARRSRVGEPFQEPRPVSAIRGFVEGPTLSSDERSLYYHKRHEDRFVIQKVTRG